MLYINIFMVCRNVQYWHYQCSIESLCKQGVTFKSERSSHSLRLHKDKYRGRERHRQKKGGRAGLTRAKSITCQSWESLQTTAY